MFFAGATLTGQEWRTPDLDPQTLRRVNKLIATTRHSLTLMSESAIELGATELTANSRLFLCQMTLDAIQQSRLSLGMADPAQTRSIIDLQNSITSMKARLTAKNPTNGDWIAQLEGPTLTKPEVEEVKKIQLEVVSLQNLIPSLPACSTSS